MAPTASRFGTFQPAPTVEGNQAQARANRSALYQLGVAVGSNKSLAYQERSSIEENRQLILKNYSAGFVGNRQMANSNTEQIFKNRDSLIRSMKAANQTQENFKQARLNESKVDFLEHRSKLNSRVAKTSEKMSDINRLLIELNQDVMAGNEEIVDFNAKMIAKNKAMIEGGLQKEMDNATPTSNSWLIASNTDRQAAILARAEKNKTSLEGHLAKIDANRNDILSNTSAIYARRKEINKNREDLEKNSLEIAALMAQM